MGLYERIRDTAKLEGYSINRLEQELGFARSSINKFNKNAPSIDKLQKIAGKLGVTVDYLMTGEDPSLRIDTVQSEKKKRLMEYAQKLLDLGVDPDALESLIDAVERMQKKD